MGIVIYLVIFLYISNWTRIHAFVPNLFNSRKTKILSDKSIPILLEKKSNLKNVTIKLIDSDVALGLMPGIPAFPVMVLTTRLLREFNDKEQEWVILHEAAHCVLYHTIKMAFLHFMLMFLGLYILIIWGSSNVMLAIILAVTLPVIYNLISRYFEYEADKYALERISDPKAMISANKKLENDKKYSYYKNDLIRTLFTPGLSYAYRIKMANNYLRTSQL